MTSPRWRKVLSDVWGNKTRTILVVLSVAIGVFAVGAVAHMNLIVARDLAESYASINPANATLQIGAPFASDGVLVDKDLLQSIHKIDGVRQAEGRRTLVMRFKYGQSDEWHPILIIAIPDYDAIAINKIEQEIMFGPDPDKWPVGAWPPPEHEIVIERTSLLLATMGLSKSSLGDSIVVQTPDERERVVRLAGLCYDFARTPATFGGMAYGYVTFDTLEWLGGPRGYSEVNLIVIGDARDKNYVQTVANRVRDKIEKGGLIVSTVVIHEPGKLPLSDTFQTITLVLGIIGFFSLFLSVFLVTNTISALLAQQVRQIGVMKAVGGRAPQIMSMYLAMVFVYGLLAIVIAVPLGALAAREFIKFLAYFLNFRLTEFRIPLEAVMIEAAVGVLVPLLAAIWPVINGTRITVRQAMTSYGLGQGKFGTGRIDRWLERLHGLPRPLTISLRNTFRRKGRLALTAITLTLACALFISVASVRTSLFLVVDDFLSYFNYDAQIVLDRAYRSMQLQNEAARVPGITRLENLNVDIAYRIRADSSESEGIQVIAVAADTHMFNPTLVQGRWLLPSDENAIVLSTEVIKREPDIKLGDGITLKMQGRDTTWQVVGVYQGLAILGPSAHVNDSYFTRTVGHADTASAIAIQTQSHDSDSQSAISKTLDEQFKRAGMRITFISTSSSMKAQISSLFDIITTLLSSMAVLVAAVGGLGLMGTMGINVLERTREIGVMRAIGASDGAIQQIVMAEGILIGVLSWLAGVLIAIPMGSVMSAAIGEGFLGGPLHYTFSIQGALVCLVGVILLAAASSYLPAQRAVQLTVREVLAYE